MRFLIFCYKMQSLSFYAITMTKKMDSINFRRMLKSPSSFGLFFVWIFDTEYPTAPFLNAFTLIFLNMHHQTASKIHQNAKFTTKCLNLPNLKITKKNHGSFSRSHVFTPQLTYQNNIFDTDRNYLR